MGYAEDYLDAVLANLQQVIRRETSRLHEAAKLIAKALAEGHQAYEFLQGHFLPTEAAQGHAERPAVFAPIRLADAAVMRLGDVLVMSHQYGVLPECVDMAFAAKRQGAYVVAMCPPSDPEVIVRSHPSGKSVPDLADLVISTHIPEGDVALQIPAGGPGACPTSGSMQAAMYWALTYAVAERLRA